MIPLYNKEAYIRRCLDSVLAQTFQDFEVLVVDDGSIDGGPGIVATYTDPRIRLIRQANGGVSVARNRGIAEAKGEWIAFLDADDEYRPEFLQKVLACAERFPGAGAVFARVAWMQGETQLNLPQDRTTEPRLLKDYLRFMAFEKGYDINASGIVIRPEVFARAGTFPVEVRVGEDSDMWLRLAWTTKIAYIPEFLSIYHMEAGASSWEKHQEGEPYWITTYRKWQKEGRIPQQLVESSEAYYQKYLLEKSLAQAFRGRKAEARRVLWRDVNWLVAPKMIALKSMFYACAPGFVARCLRRGRR